jgi:transcriptional regulator with XRE-family HTH domain
MENSALQQIGKMIKALRESEGLTQSELAKRAGLTQAAISQFEEGKRVPSTRAIQKIADGLGVSLDTLVSESSASQQDDPEKEAAIRQLLGLVKDMPADKILNLNRFLADDRKP